MEIPTKTNETSLRASPPTMPSIVKAHDGNAPTENQGVETAQHLPADFTVLTLATPQEPAPATPRKWNDLSHLFHKLVINPDMEEWVKCTPGTFSLSAYLPNHSQMDASDTHSPHDTDRIDKGVSNVYMSNSADKNEDGAGIFRPSTS
jgi:hypothetical protein